MVREGEEDNLFIYLDLPVSSAWVDVEAEEKTIFIH